MDSLNIRSMQAVKRLFAKYPKIHYAPLAAILAAAAYFYFHNLGTNYITLWDEAVHVNVVKNLARDCCTPKLHLTDIGIDFQDWTSNYIWVHKPLMPLYLQAAVYKQGGESLFAFRLPSALTALLIVAALFLVTRRHFGFAAALIASALFAFNPYMVDLVKGRQFSGLHDLMFCFFGILALDRVLKIADLSSRPTPNASEGERRDPLTVDHSKLDDSLPVRQSGLEKRGSYLLFGLFAGLAYLSKGGLALLFFPVLLVPLSMGKNRREIFLNIAYAGLASLILIFPEKIILAFKYPAEYAFEQRVQVLHLFKDLEYWGRPWHYYWSVYLKEMAGAWLYWPALASMAYGVFRSYKDMKFRILVVWALSFLVVLSFGVSKVPNFIFAAMPSIFILTALLLHRVWHYPVARWLAPAVLVLALSGNLKTNLAREKGLPPGFAVQSQLKAAGEYAARALPQNSVSLIWYPSLQKSHLFFKYWSYRDAVEIYDRQPIYHMEKLYGQRPVYVFSQENLSRKELKLLQTAPFGYVYKVSR